MSRTQVDVLRSFNRFFTRRIGVLDQSFLGQGRPLAQARLLYEIGRNGADVRSLRTQLGLDSGYLSRMIRAMEREGMIATDQDERDARRRVLKLSKRGLVELAQYDRRSDEFAQSLLDPLDGQQRARLVEAMTEVGRLLRIASLTIAVEAPDTPESLWCLEQYYRELARRFDSGFDPARSISATPSELTPPHGAFVVARCVSQPVGCGALKIKTDGIGEIKRMWVDPGERGMGIGQRILAELERQAARFGVHKLRLETNRTLREAQQLYKKCGYVEVGAFNDEPYAHFWFEKSLPAKTVARRRARSSKVSK